MHDMDDRKTWFEVNFDALVHQNSPSFVVVGGLYHITELNEPAMVDVG